MERVGKNLQLFGKYSNNGGKMKNVQKMEKKIQKYELCQVERVLSELMEKTLKMENELITLYN